MDGPGVEVWRGGVNHWDCDEMGHMNVRVYVALAMEGLAAFAPRLGLIGAFSAAANSTLVLREHHIRFLREARSRAPLHMTAGVLEIDACEALLVQVLTHSETGEPCAAFQTRIAHVTASEMRPFPWSDRTRERAQALTVELPPFAAAKSLGQGRIATTASLQKADALGLTPMASGVFGAGDCDVFGRMEAHHFIGKVTSAILKLVGDFRQTVAEHAPDKPQNVGSAVLEYRVLHLDWPRAGDGYAVRSGISGVTSRAQLMTHWMLDPVSGRPWVVAEAAVTPLDLDKRKMIPVTDEAQKVIAGRAVKGLAL